MRKVGNGIIHKTIHDARDLTSFLSLKDGGIKLIDQCDKVLMLRIYLGIRHTERIRPYNLPGHAFHDKTFPKTIF